MFDEVRTFFSPKYVNDRIHFKPPTLCETEKHCGRATAILLTNCPCQELLHSKLLPEPARLLEVTETQRLCELGQFCCSSLEFMLTVLPKATHRDTHPLPIQTVDVYYRDPGCVDPLISLMQRDILSSHYCLPWAENDCT